MENDLRRSSLFPLPPTLNCQIEIDLGGGILFMIVHYIVYLCFAALFCMYVVFVDKKVKPFNVLPTKRFLGDGLAYGTFCA